METSDEDQNHLFDLFAKLQISIDSMASEQRKQREANQRRYADLPRAFPLPYSVQLDGAGNGLVSLKGPQAGREWIVRQITASHSGYGLANSGTAYASTGASAVGAAGAATSVSITGPAFITGFDVTIGPATATGTATVTLSGVAGGPYTWYIDELTTNSESLSKSLNLATTGTATLSVSAVASGGTVALNLYATTGTSPADVQWFRGTNIANGQNVTLPPNLCFARMHGTPAEISFTSDVVRIVQNQEVIITVQGGVPSGLVQGSLNILDQPVYVASKTVAVQ